MVTSVREDPLWHFFLRAFFTALVIFFRIFANLSNRAEFLQQTLRAVLSCYWDTGTLSLLSPTPDESITCNGVSPRVVIPSASFHVSGIGPGRMLYANGCAGKQLHHIFVRTLPPDTSKPALHRVWRWQSDHIICLKSLFSAAASNSALVSSHNSRVLPMWYLRAFFRGGFGNHIHFIAKNVGPFRVKTTAGYSVSHPNDTQ